jgi:urea transport system substrate-binding protein
MAPVDTTITRRGLGGLGAAALTLAAMGAVKETVTPAVAQTAPSGGTIKVGVLHSLSGTMAISETTLKDVMLMLIDAQNKKGGLLGKKLEAVVVDPASNWPLFAEKARGLLSVDKCAAVLAAGPRYHASPCCRYSRS